MHQTSRGVIRSLMLSAAAAALITAATAAGGTAIAQESATTPKPVVPREAPVGHRQPRVQDLPRNVQETEGNRSKGETELDDKLKSICRGC